MHGEMRQQMRGADSVLPALVVRDERRSVVVADGTSFTEDDGGGAIVIVVIRCSLDLSPIRLLRSRAALPGLRLVEDLRHHQLPVLLLLVGAQVILVHYPAGLLRLPLLAVVGVQDEDLFVPLEPPTHQHRPRLPGLVPPRLASACVEQAKDWAGNDDRRRQTRGQKRRERKRRKKLVPLKATELSSLPPSLPQFSLRYPGRNRILLNCGSSSSSREKCSKKNSDGPSRFLKATTNQAQREKEKDKNKAICRE
ncbi:hypothetical protein B296_00038779 [Ensete ventricosum]|uniref:Uncharacterized protein n=1 Tax=Ensete ventricosum TaxID=4639 RepID=A0A426YJ99_ENSVE|nr:hypothetical protein B296_00038779 [Ensete ventricosum]